MNLAMFLEMFLKCKKEMRSIEKQTETERIKFLLIFFFFLFQYSGVYVWLLQNHVPTKVEDTEQGIFYQDDAYLILNVKTNTNANKYNKHKYKQNTNIQTLQTIENC